MKLRQQLVILGVFLACVFQLENVQARGPSTPEERARVIELTRWLEHDPLNENAPATRQWLRTWIAEVPDIRFMVCDDLLGHALNDNYPYSREVNQQVLLSGASYLLEHQDKARDPDNVYNAGVEGALRVYEVLLKSKPDAKFAFLDDLIAKRNQGQLFDYVARVSSDKCKTSNIALIVAPAGAAVGLALALLIAWVGAWPAHRSSALDGLKRANRSVAIAITSRRVVFICATYYVIVGITLHLLEPEYDPRYRFMSEYAWGAYGWLMTTTFFVLGLAITAVAVAVRKVHQSSRSTRVGFGLLLVAAAGVCLAGVFRDFLPHSAASAVGLPSIIIAALLLSWRFRSSEGWKTVYPIAILVALGMLALFISIIIDVGLPGLQQRVFLFLILFWLSVVANHSVRVMRADSLESTKDLV